MSWLSGFMGRCIDAQSHLQLAAVAGKMPYQATVIRVMIATPGDVAEERKIIRDVIHDWNDVNSVANSVVLLAVGWDTHAVPELGQRPQQLINDRVLKDCDLLIGVFWTRLGSHTGKASSGTVEEINEHANAGKPVMIYFSAKPAAPASIDPEQYARVEVFKRECRDRGLFETFDTADEFKAKVTKQLQICLYQNEYLKFVIRSGLIDVGNPPIPPVAVASMTPPVYPLTLDAQKLLKLAAVPNMGYIYKVSNVSGIFIQAGQSSFGGEDVRESARWQAALAELVAEGMVKAEGYKGEVFLLTHRGWRASDGLLNLTS